MNSEKFRRLAVGFAGLNGAIAVIIGAWAAHGLEARIGANALEWARTASAYQLWHALALLLAVLLGARAEAKPAIRMLSLAAIGFALGQLLFCGALYALAFGLPRWFGAVAPIGGLSFILGWLAIFLAAFLGGLERGR